MTLKPPPLTTMIKRRSGGFSPAGLATGVGGPTSKHTRQAGCRDLKPTNPPVGAYRACRLAPQLEDPLVPWFSSTRKGGRNDPVHSRGLNCSYRRQRLLLVAFSSWVCCCSAISSHHARTTPTWRDLGQIGRIKLLIITIFWCLLRRFHRAFHSPFLPPMTPSTAQLLSASEPLQVPWV